MTKCLDVEGFTIVNIVMKTVGSNNMLTFVYRK